MVNLGPLLIFLAATLWAFDGILRRTLYTLPPINIVFFEHLLGALILLPLTAKLLKANRLSAKQWSSIIWVSLLSGVLGTLWFTTALVKVNFIPFSVVYLLQKLQPIFAIATAKLILKESLPKNYLLLAGTAIIAAFFVTFPNGQIHFTTDSSHITAALYAVGAAFAWGTSTAFSRYTLLKQPHTLITGLRFLLTTIIAFPLIFLFRTQVQLASITFSQFATLLVITLSTGMFALWVYYQGLKQTPAKISTILELAFPVTAVGIDIVLYHTILLPSQYLAALILFIAITRLVKQST